MISTHEETVPADAVAIVGLAGRFPGAEDVSSFWRNLREGVESVERFTAEDLRAAGVSEAVIQDPRYVPAGTVLKHMQCFDAAFFGYTPREAELMDPQHRIFLEVAWAAIEDAAYDVERCKVSFGVFAGAGLNHYFLSNVAANPEVAASGESYQAALGAEKDFLATRVSYKLNLKGPSIAVQTSCSTSLVAVHLACQSLLLYECDMALAGGVFAGAYGKAGYLYHDGMILSKDGHCRAFDANASGTVAGKGAAAVVLKRLSDAVADGDRIYAVIRGSAVNNDGSLKVSYMAPSVPGQAAVIARALENAGVGADTIDYVETHGTGTQLGDPAEIAGLCRAFGTRPRARNCLIGSVKTNIGHLDAAAGVTGLIKAALALWHREIPPSLHFQKPNPEIDFATSALEVNSALQPWPSSSTPRRAGVSCFGVGGTNAHVILEEAPLSETRPDLTLDRPSDLFVLSARTPQALERMSGNLAAYLRAHPELDRRDVAHTLQLGRRQFVYRRMWVATDLTDLASALETGRLFGSTLEPSERGVVFMFSGQGSQYPGMGAGLYRYEKVFRETIDRCADLLQARMGMDLRRLMMETGLGTDAALRLEQTDIAQPALFVLNYALAQLWMSWGITPKAMIGHSLGEYVAACLAGVFSLEDALMLVAERGRLMRDQPPGGMTAVSASVQQIETSLATFESGKDISIAAINGPSMCVVSGPLEVLQKLEDKFRQEGLEIRRLHTSHAFHSPLMREAAQAFGEFIRKVKLSAPSRRFVSNVTGRWISEKEARDPAYWVRHMLAPVRFSEGLKCVSEELDPLWLEVGPGHALATLAKAQVRESAWVMHSLRHAREKTSDTDQVLGTLGRIWLMGEAVDWDAFGQGRDGRSAGLPTYPFEREKFWIEPRPRGGTEPVRQKGAHETRSSIDDWFYSPVWKTSLRLPTQADSGGSWLIVSDRGARARTIAEALRVGGQQAIVASTGAGFVRSSETEYSVDLSNGQRVAELIQDLGSRGPLPTRVVYVSEAASDLEVSDEASGLAASVYSAPLCALLALARCFAEARSTMKDSMELLVVSQGACSVAGEGRVDARQGLLLGASRVISQEYPRIRCRCIDVLAGPLDPGCLSGLIRELQFETSESPVVLRGGARWVRAFEALSRTSAQVAPNRLRQGGVYFITGGLGAIGLEMASFLARKFQARLVLVSRTRLPDRTLWQSLISQSGVEPRLHRMLTAIQSMEALGSEVMTVAADVCSEADMHRALKEAEARFGRVHGVIHAAGKAGGGIVARRSMESVNAVLAPKVQGSLVLAQVFENVSLDFLALFSSMASLLGGVGQADYAAANSFLDSFVEQRRWKGDTRYVCLNWDLWGEVGMGLDALRDAPGLKSSRADALSRGIRSAEGTEAFARALSLSLSQVLISLRSPELALATVTQTGSTAEVGVQSKGHARPHLNQPAKEPEDDIQRAVQAIWHEVLGIRGIGVDDNLFELGGHSLLAIRIASRLAETFQVEVPLQAVFDSPTIAGLARELISREPSPGQTMEIAQLVCRVETMSAEQLLLAAQADSNPPSK